MNPADAYKPRDLVNWTRVEMLIAMYDEALQQIETADKTENPLVRSQHRLKAMRIVAHLRSGLDPSFGELPQKMSDLFDFVVSCLADDEPERDKAATEVLKKLRSGFESVRGTAIELESRGEITPLGNDPGIERTA